MCVRVCVCFATLSWSTETHCSASMCVCVCVLCHVVMEHWNTLQCQYVCVCVCVCVCFATLSWSTETHCSASMCVCACVCFATLSWSTETHCSASMCVCVCVLCHVIMEHWNTLQCQYVCVRVCALPHYHGALKHIAVPVCVCAYVCFASLSWSTETHCRASSGMRACCVSVLLRVSQSIKTLPVGMHVVCLFCYVCHRASRRCQLVCMSCVFSITCVTEHQDVASWYACCEHARVCVFVSGKWRGKCSGGECLSSANRSAVTGSVVTQEHYT